MGTDNENLSIHQRLHWTVYALDVFISVMSSLSSVLLMRWLTEPFLGFQHYVLGWILVSLAASALSFHLFKIHMMVIRYLSFMSIGKFISAVFVKEFIIAAAIPLGIITKGSIQLNVITLILDLFITIFLLVAVRIILIQIVENTNNASIDDKLDRLRVMVYGLSNKSTSMLTRLDTSSHYEVIGFITPGKVQDGLMVMDKKVYGCDDAAELEELRNKLGIESILFTQSSDELSQKVLSACIDLGITILNMPRIESSAVHEVTQDAVKDLGKKDMFIYDGMTAVARSTKRIIDCVIAALCLIVFSPLFLAVFIAIKLEDHGPAIYKQERVGRFGRPFYIYKFRSMRIDAEAAGPALYAGEEDPRLTKVGRFIRAHHLDELPQLWNVFRGDMAFIGPRPERQFYIDQIMEQDPRYYYLYQIRPGVTSYATLYNGYTDTLEKMLKRLEYDLYYLRHRSLWFDVRILFMTFTNIVFGKIF